MTAKALEIGASRCFDRLVLFPITVAQRTLGEGIWNPLDQVTGTLSRVAGRIMGPFLSGRGMHQLSSAMELVDKVEAAVGVRGTKDTPCP